MVSLWQIFGITFACLPSRGTDPISVVVTAVGITGGTLETPAVIKQNILLPAKREKVMEEDVLYRNHISHAFIAGYGMRPSKYWRYEGLIGGVLCRDVVT